MGKKEHAISAKADTSVRKAPRGSPVAVALFGIFLLGGGLYIGGWFDTVTPAQTARCQETVRSVFPAEADQKLLLSKCTNRHLVAGMESPARGRLEARQIVENLEAGKRLDVIALFLGGALMGGGIAALAAAHRLHRRRMGKEDTD